MILMASDLFDGNGDDAGMMDDILFAVTSQLHDDLFALRLVDLILIDVDLGGNIVALRSILCLVRKANLESISSHGGSPPDDRLHCNGDDSGEP
jgi:hypothetical protein